MKFFTQEGQVAFINAVAPYLIMSFVVVLAGIGGYIASFSIVKGAGVLIFAVLSGVSYTYVRKK